MKEKILTKEISSNKETATTEKTVENKTETISIVNQETICQNINNLAGALPDLSDIDPMVLDAGIQEKLFEIKINIINALHYQSTHLQDKDI